MKKITLIILNLLLISPILTQLFSKNKCEITTFGEFGSSCDPSSSKKCKIFSTCLNSTCKASHIGAPCQVAQDCFLNENENGNFGIRCVNSICKKPSYPGFFCESDLECYNNKCEGGICKGLPLGQPCQPDLPAQCDKGLFCSIIDNKCHEQIDVNQSCHFHHSLHGNRNLRDIKEGHNFWVICKGGHICRGDPQDQKCLPFKNGDVGAPCNFTRDGHSECAYGLNCNQETHQCYEHGGTIKKCDERDCRRNEECVCDNDQKGKCVVISNENNVCGFYDTAKEWVECLKVNNCPLTGLTTFDAWLIESLATNTCAGRYCSKNIDKFLCCMIKDQNKNQYSRYQLGPLTEICNPPKNYAAIVIPVLLLVVITLIVATLGLMLIIIAKVKGKREAKYEEVN